jgi:hypothetical protein
MTKEVQPAYYRLLEPSMVRQKLSQILSYWPAVILVVGGIVVTLCWIAALAWLILHLLDVV